METQNLAISPIPYVPAIQSALHQASAAINYLTSVGVTIEFQLTDKEGVHHWFAFDKDSTVTMVVKGKVKVPGHD